MRTPPFLTVMLAISLTACDSSDDARRGKVASSQRPSTTAAKDLRASAPPPRASSELAVPTSDHTALLETLEAWIRTQNQGDFAAYRSLYAEKFTGIRRSGSRTFQADREDWLKDRSAMFSRPTTVEAKDIVVSGGGSSARITFVQDFRTPTFRDHGPKELQLLKLGERWQIAREEMLSSAHGDARPPARRLNPGDFSFVRQVPHGTLILLDRYANLTPIQGKLQHVRDGVVLREVRESSVEERYRSLVGKRFRVYAADGSSCDVIADHLTIYAESKPHFGTLATWHGEGSEHRVYSEAERALESWRMIGDERWIALSSKHRCVGGWARLAEAKAPVVYTTPSGKLPIEDAARAALATTDTYASMQDWAKTNLQNTEPRTGTRVFEGPGGAQFVAAFAEFGVGFCAEFGGRHFGIFRRTGETVSPVTDLASGYGAGPLGRTYDVVMEQGLPSLAIDLEHDGTPEFLFENVLFAFTGARYEIIREARVPDFDCHC